MTSRVRVIGDLYHGRIPTGAVYIGRAAPGLPASPYANPHKVGLCRLCQRVHADREEAVAAYAARLAARRDLVDAARRDLVGFNLACWCALDELCHGDVLLAVLAGRNPLHWAPTARRPRSALTGGEEITLW